VEVSGSGARLGARKPSAVVLLLGQNRGSLESDL